VYFAIKNAVRSFRRDNNPELYTGIRESLNPYTEGKVQQFTSKLVSQSGPPLPMLFLSSDMDNSCPPGPLDDQFDFNAPATAERIRNACENHISNRVRSR
jgi:hypothetical protein